MAVADPQREAHRRGELLADRIEALHGPQDVTCFDEKPFARRGERDLAAGALEQAQAEVLLELADALREGRRRDVQPSGSAPEVTLLGDGHEVPEVAHVGAGHEANVIGLDMICVGVGRGLFERSRGTVGP